MGLRRTRMHFIQILLTVIILSFFSAHVCADTLILFDKMPKNSNGENSILLQSRIGNEYTDLKSLPDVGDYWFGTPGTFKQKPVITRGVIPNQQYDKLAVFAWPSAVVQTGYKSDSVIRVTIPGNGSFVKISGQGALEGKGTASHYRFYIYKGESQYDKPLWEVVGGGNFNLNVNYSANDQIFFATEALDSDDELRPKWKSVVLETYTDQVPSNPISAPTPQTSFPISQQQENPSFPLPLILVVLLVVVCIGAIGYHKYRKKSQIPTRSSPAISPGALSNKDHHDVFISYSSVDKPVADAMCARIEAQNIRCWIAPRDVTPGKNFPEAIMEGIEGSKIMVIIFSSHSNKSEHVIREVTTAINKSLMIIPFRIEDVLPSKSMEYLIGTPHWLNALTPPLENHLDSLIITIKKNLSNNEV